MKTQNESENESEFKQYLKWLESGDVEMRQQALGHLALYVKYSPGAFLTMLELEQRKNTFFVEGLLAAVIRSASDLANRKETELSLPTKEEEKKSQVFRRFGITVQKGVKSAVNATARVFTI